MKAKRKVAKKKLVLAIVAVLAVALVFIGISLFKSNHLSDDERQELLATGTFHEGISIDGIDVSGMTIAQASPEIEAGMARRLDEININMSHAGSHFTLTSADFSISDNIDEVMEEAMLLGREGSVMSVSAEVDAIKREGREFTTEYTVDEASIAQRLSGVAAQINSEPVDASVEVDKDKIKEWFTFVEEQNGVDVEEAALLGAVKGQIQSKNYGDIEVPVIEIPAQISIEDLKAKVVLRGTATTSFANSPYNRAERVFNVKKATDMVNGHVLKPGEEFSTNTVLGRRTYALGWQPAPAYVQGGSEDQAGGGVCQVSSTMYAAVLKSDLEIVYRRAHSRRVGYIGGGLDATINTDTIDFKYKNHTDSDVYIFCWTDNSKKLHFEIYGVPLPDEYDEIRLSSEQTGTVEPSGEMLITVDNSKPPGYEETTVQRRSGSIFKSYKHYYKNGVEVREPEFIAETKYMAYNGTKIMGPPKPPEPVETQEPTPTSPPTDQNGGDNGGQTNPPDTED
ncbi:MAG: VanW family protein [Christensenellales bacterium]|jgi:vancomycin resistance protein YoaR